MVPFTIPKIRRPAFRTIRINSTCCADECSLAARGHFHTRTACPSSMRTTTTTTMPRPSAPHVCAPLALSTAAHSVHTTARQASALDVLFAAISAIEPVHAAPTFLRAPRPVAVIRSRGKPRRKSKSVGEHSSPVAEALARRRTCAKPSLFRISNIITMCASVQLSPIYQLPLLDAYSDRTPRAPHPPRA